MCVALPPAWARARGPPFAPGRLRPPPHCANVNNHRLRSIPVALWDPPRRSPYASTPSLAASVPLDRSPPPASDAFRPAGDTGGWVLASARRLDSSRDTDISRTSPTVVLTRVDISRQVSCCWLMLTRLSEINDVRDVVKADTPLLSVSSFEATGSYCCACSRFSRNARSKSFRSGHTHRMNMNTTSSRGALSPKLRMIALTSSASVIVSHSLSKQKAVVFYSAHQDNCRATGCAADAAPPLALLVAI